MTPPAATRTRGASAAELAAQINAIRRTPNAARELTPMLAEQSRLFAGRGSNEVERLRGYILASFETAGLPPEAVPFVLEELETGRNPYTVAAAARALRGASTMPPEAPRLLVGALARLRGADDLVSFERFEAVSSSGNGLTALGELARTLALLGPGASGALQDLKALIRREGESFSPSVRTQLDEAVEALSHRDSTHACCGAEPEPVPADDAPPSGPTDLERLALEDQDGARLSFAEAFSGRPTALTFFYTRCMNPEKCSLTVTKLARLARHLEEAALDANVAGISYDPGFDRPARLKGYGAERGLNFSPRRRLLRTIGPFDPLRDAFELGVGFGPVTVNRHRIDLVVLGPTLRVTERFQRLLWQEDRVLHALRAAATSHPVRGH